MELYTIAKMAKILKIPVNESDLRNYVKATKDFWDEMPERAYSDADTIIEEFKNKK